MQNSRLDGSQAGIKISERNINNLRYAEVAYLMGKWRGTKKPLDEGERGEWKADLKLNIQKTKIMASSSITSWQIVGKTVEVVTDFTFLASRIIDDSDCSHEIKSCLLHGRKAVTNLDSVLKTKDITLPTKVHIAKL